MSSAYLHHCLTAKIRNRKAGDAVPRAVNDFLALIDGLLLFRLKGKADALTFEIFKPSIEEAEESDKVQVRRRKRGKTKVKLRVIKIFGRRTALG